jgi:galactonate dehydratase
LDTRADRSSLKHVRIEEVVAIPVRVPRDLGAARGTAGSPNALEGSGRYRWSVDYPVLYATELETALVRIKTSSGLIGWGEAQAPLAPEVACAIVDHLLAPVLTGQEFDGTIEEIDLLWSRMYSTMRVRGQTGGFMLDAISGIDLALWDLAGKIAQKPVCELLAGEAAKKVVPAYLSGVNGASEDQRVEYARTYIDQGFQSVKLYYESSWDGLLSLCGRIRPFAHVAVDALWHLPPEHAIDYARALDQHDPLWLECPLMPEEVDAHAELAAAISTKLAIGESYRTHHELRPFVERGIAGYLQPDLGRCGITESRRIGQMGARVGLEIVPHVSIALPPQLAAAIHFAAATPNCTLCEYNPKVLEAANRFSKQPLRAEKGSWIVPSEPGLGVEVVLS